MQTYLRFVSTFARSILAVLFVATCFFLTQLPKLTTDSNPYLLSEDHPARKTILDMQKEFTGTYDAVLVALYNDKDVFNKQTLEALYYFTHHSRLITLATASDAEELRRISARYPQEAELSNLSQQILEGGFQQNDYFLAEKLLASVKTASLSKAERSFLAYLPRRINPIKELAGMAASENILMRDDTLVVRTSLDRADADPARVKEEVMGNQMMHNAAVSRDVKVALLAVELYIAQDDAEGQLRAYQLFKDMVAGYQAQHPEFTDAVHIAGVPIFIAESKALIDRDMQRLFPIVVAIVAIVLALFFRRSLGVVLPLLNVVLCAIWTLGLMAMLRVPLDLMTSVLPVFLITICGADAIHLMSEYYEQLKQGRDNKTAIENTMHAIVSPVVLTTVTTVVGFLVSTAVNLTAVRTFGIFMAVGLCVAQIISLLLIPAWIFYFTPTGVSKRVQEKSTRPDRFGAFLEGALSILISHRRIALSFFAISFCGALVLATHVHVEDAGAEYFAKSNRFRQSDDFVNKHVAGTSPGWITVGANGPRSVIRRDVVEFIGKLDTFLLNQPNVTYTYSLSTYIKRMMLVMNDMQESYNRLPNVVENIEGEDISGDEVVSQAVLMYENGGGSELNNVLNSDFSKAATLFTMNTTRASDYRKFLDTFHAWLKLNKPSELDIKIGGTPVIWSGVLDELISGQIISDILALCSICLVLSLWLRSVRLGILTTIPLAVTLVFYYASMTILGIDLNIGTSLISFMIVGIVDYSAHLLHGILSRLKQGDSLDQSMLYTIRHSGKSIALNVLIFSSGFLALLFSEFTPVVNLGSLVAVALSISGFMSVFIITMLGPWLIVPKAWKSHQNVEPTFTAANRDVSGGLLQNL